MRLFIGQDLPNSKVRSASSLDNIPIRKLKTRFIKFGRRILPWHVELVNELGKFKPDVILCEGESHFLGYIQAIYYRARYAKRTALIHWCYISLPGESAIRRDIAALIKAYFRRHFDAFVVYSSFSKDRLIKTGEDRRAVFVATNVGDVNKFTALADSLEETKFESRRKLGLPDLFTVLYVGTLDENKRPDLLLDLAQTCDCDLYSFVLLGSGPLLDSLRMRASNEGLSNVCLPGQSDG